MKNNPIFTDSRTQVVRTRPRQTALPASRRFASELKNTAVSGASSLLRVGGAIMGAALPAGDTGAVRTAASAGLGAHAMTSTALASGAVSPNVLGASADASMMDQSMELLALQQQIQMENQRYTTLSNVLKARHETNKNAISNLR